MLSSHLCEHSGEIKSRRQLLFNYCKRTQVAELVTFTAGSQLYQSSQNQDKSDRCDKQMYYFPTSFEFSLIQHSCRILCSCLAKIWLLFVIEQLWQWVAIVAILCNCLAKDMATFCHRGNSGSSKCLQCYSTRDP